MKRLSLIALLLTGCATQPETHWYKAGASDRDWEIDAAQCRAQAGASFSLPQFAVVYTNCMYGKGWERR